MFYIVLIFHILIYIEIFTLMKKKLRKTGIVLFVLNLIMTIMNLIALAKTFGIPYSSVVYLKEELKLHPIANILWMILNAFLILYLWYAIKLASKKQKQNKFLKCVFYVYTFVICYIPILTIIPKWSLQITFALLVAFLIINIRDFIKTKQNYRIFTSVLMVFLLGYFYCTKIGSAKLSLIFEGYPIQAFETGFEELKYYKEENITKYSPIEKIPLKDGQVTIIEVKNIGFIKFSKIN